MRWPTRLTPSRRGGGRLLDHRSIDGTTNYARGVPIWATLIALVRDGEVVAAVASAPALGRRWWAARGRGAWSFLSVRSFVRLGLLDGLLELSQRAHSTRGIGDFWQHMLVAEGALDFAVDTMLRVWDFAAVKLIVEEAGGRFTNLAAESPADSDACMSSNGRLHDEVLEVIRGHQQLAESRAHSGDTS